MSSLTRSIAFAVASLAAACGAAPRVARIGMNAPNPDGCYIKVYDGERFGGIGDFINGPMRYPMLGALANGANWRNRIRSLKVGPAATASVWANPNFAGESLLLRTDLPYPTLPERFVAEIESVDIMCTAAARPPNL